MLTRLEIDAYVGVGKAERVLLIEHEFDEFARLDVARIYKKAVLAHAVEQPINVGRGRRRGRGGV